MHGQHRLHCGGAEGRARCEPALCGMCFCGLWQPGHCKAAAIPLICHCSSSLRHRSDAVWLTLVTVAPRVAQGAEAGALAKRRRLAACKAGGEHTEGAIVGNGQELPTFLHSNSPLHAHEPPQCSSAA